MGDAGGWWRSKRPAGPFDPLTLLSDKYVKGAFFAIETGMRAVFHLLPVMISDRNGKRVVTRGAFGATACAKGVVA